MVIKISEQELRQKYLIEGISASDIAKEHNCACNTITEKLRKYGIRVRTTKEIANMPLVLVKHLSRLEIFKVSKAEFENLYIKQKLSMKKIAKLLNSDKRIIKHMLQHYNIPLRSQNEVNKLKSEQAIRFQNIHNLSKEELEHQYFNENKSIIDIASEYHCSPTPIIDRMKELGIKFKDRIEASVKYKISKDELIRRYCDLGMTVVEIGKELGCTHRNISRKLKRYGIKARNWENMTIEEKDERVKRVMHGMGIRPNKPETYLMCLLNFAYPNEFKYVGDGQVVLGGKNPDYLNVNGKKILVELFGDFWHRGQNPKNRIMFFKKYGFNTLVIWERELCQPKKVLNKIVEFVENYQEVEI